VSLKKLDYSICYFETSGFNSFRIKSRKEVDLDLKIQGVLRHEKGLKSIKESKWKKSKPKVKAAKNWTIWFWILEYPIFSE
jgi:hypothetical protein